MLVTAVIRKIKPGKVSRHADKVKAKKREEESCVAWWRADSSNRQRRAWCAETVNEERVNRRPGMKKKRETRVASIDRCVGSHPCAWVHHRSNGYANGPSVTR